MNCLDVLWQICIYLELDLTWCHEVFDMNSPEIVLKTYHLFSVY